MVLYNTIMLDVPVSTHFNYILYRDKVQFGHQSFTPKAYRTLTFISGQFALIFKVASLLMQ